MDLLPVWIVTNIKRLDRVKTPHFFEEASEEYVLILNYYSEYNCFMSCLEKKAWGTLIPITTTELSKLQLLKTPSDEFAFQKLIKIEKVKIDVKLTWKLIWKINEIDKCCFLQLLLTKVCSYLNLPFSKYVNSAIFLILNTGNGDILSFEEANLRRETTGVSGLMIAR